MKHYICIIALLASLLLTCIGCQDFDPVAEGVITSPKFDFATEHPVAISIDYGPMAAGSLINLYFSDPLAHATGPESLPEGEPFLSTYLDEAGRYEHSILLPTYADRVYAYSESWHAPYLLSSQIEQGNVMLHALISSPYAQSSTRADNGGSEQLTVRKLDTNECTSNPGGKYFTINGGWDGYGKYSEDVNKIIFDGEFAKGTIDALQYMLWGNSTTKNGGSLDNRKYLIQNGNPNLYIVDKYEKDGVTHKVKDAEVFFTFLSESAWNENTIGYYYYPKGQRPNSFDDINKYIIIPNASIAYHPPFGDKANSYSQFSNDYAPVEINTRVQLLYVYDNGDVSRNFPVGTEIGFFVMCDAFRLGSGNGTDKNAAGKYTKREKGMIKTTDLDIWKSDSEWNSDQKHHYIVLKLNDGTLVYGTEDAKSDYSYEDVLFTITATPNEAMDTEGELANDSEVNITPIPKPDITNKEKKYTYAFEDMWPDGGDYDINDAVVRHEKTLTYSAMGYAKIAEDKFTFVQVPNANTAYKDAFAISLPANHIDVGITYTLPEGAKYEQETHSIILTEDVRHLYGKSITLKRVFSNAIRWEAIRDEDCNPFIINMTKGPVYTQNNRIEIHLPGHQPTSKGQSANDTPSPWYITKDGQYPYALRFPTVDFQPTAEGQRIDKKYPNYNNWVESRGTQNADWYKSK